MKVNFAEDETRWLDALCDTLVREVIPSAMGGILVLCTSYTQIAGLRERLETHGVPASRLVTQSRDKKFSQVRSNHIETYRAGLGLRPITLALGPAWTGFDLNDESSDAKTDCLLTDVVIGRFPIGLNRSNAMEDRIRRMGTWPIIQEALMTLKQGIGRLMRRPDVMYRRIWILDGRVEKRDWTGMKDFVRSVRWILKPYAKRRTIG